VTTSQDDKRSENDAELICARCGSKVKAASASHLYYCNGKCERCSDKNLVCSFLPHQRACLNCKIESIDSCIRHLTRKTCGHCGRSMNASNISLHIVTCVGKCQNCDRENIPCDIRAVRSKHFTSCTNFQNLGLVCIGPVSNIDAVRHETGRRDANRIRLGTMDSGRHNSEKHDPKTRVCPRCGQIRTFTTYGYFDEHVRSCVGKCTECEKEGIPCLNLRGNEASCEGCNQSGANCSGRASHQDMAINKRRCPRCGTIPPMC
jgi:hypothetical protein